MLAALAGCYSPATLSDLECEPESSNCNGDSINNDTPQSPPLPSQMCYGEGLLGPICLAPPARTLALTGASTIDTAQLGDTGCTKILAVSGGPSLCLVAARRIEVSGVLRAVGTHPLVLLASDEIAVTGFIDVSSHIRDANAGRPVAGAGARTAAACRAPFIDGPMSDDDQSGGSGGAGGSFGGLGGRGGLGAELDEAGVPAAGAAASLIAGGCPGGRGGDDSSGLGGGLAGAGGGAVYLIAGSVITLRGKIAASGAAGGGGTFGFESSGAGGGGGSGGMIGLDAPRVVFSGALVANGGGGGGGGAYWGASGGDGGESDQPGSAATGGVAGLDGGGSGGAGSVSAIAGRRGANGTSDFAAGGGGGGGPGIIRVYGAPASSISGAISPPPQ